MNARGKKFLTAAVFVVLFAIGAAGGVVLFRFGLFDDGKPAGPVSKRENGEQSVVRVYYPYAGRLQMEERKVKRIASMQSAAESTVLEFLKGPAGADGSYVPKGVELLGVYMGSDRVLYVDLSEEVRVNFHGDALEEFLLLRGLYESIVSNVQGLEGVKVLIAGREAETLGGHVSLARPLGESVSQTIKEENEAP